MGECIHFVQKLGPYTVAHPVVSHLLINASALPLSDFFGSGFIDWTRMLSLGAGQASKLIWTACLSEWLKDLFIDASLESRRGTEKMYFIICYTG